jgi:dipeptidyl aminopeptidase/acylaminoacyl peptidase
VTSSPGGEVAPTEARYGTWPSPLSADLVAAGSVGLGGPVPFAGGVVWSELRPAEAGRAVLVGRTGPRESPAVDLLEAPWSARTLVHEYGGGAWWPGRDRLYFCHWADQRLYRFIPAELALVIPAPDESEAGAEGAGAGTGPDPEALTPEPPAPRAWRYADGREHPSERWLVCVRERHGDGPEAVNELVAIATGPVPEDGPAEPRVVGAGPDGTPQADFVAAPRFSPDGRWLSWIRWDHPRMPWDGTELCVAPVFAGLRLGNTQVVAGGEAESIQGADWAADGRLVFSTDRSGFWNLHTWTPGSGAHQPLTALDGAEIGAPQWVFGTQHWTELPGGRLVAVVTEAAVDRLVVVEPSGSLSPVGSDLVSVAELTATDRGTILVNGSTATVLPALLELSPDGAVVAEIRSPAALLVDGEPLDPAWFSTARTFSYPSGRDPSGPGGARQAHAFFYPPTGAGRHGPAGERPPLVVMGHGGPTAHASAALSLRIQYWTSRGFAVADVNYGGSTGFGRAYRQLLNGAWGVVDVEDSVAVALELARAGEVDRDRLAIRGGSAGGFTVLSALVQSEVFSAGTNLFGVADLEALARDTHKFESRYLDSLVGPYPERRDLYQERSPINHTDGLSCPLLVLQGLEDEVVPPNQSEAIVAAVAAKGIPHAYLAFEGEQHGFRQHDNIVRSYEVELWFYGRVFGFEPADPIEPPAGAVGL